MMPRTSATVDLVEELRLSNDDDITGIRFSVAAHQIACTKINRVRQENAKGDRKSIERWCDRYHTFWLVSVERRQCPFAEQDGDSIAQIQSSRVKRFVRRRMAGAANSTIGSIMIQATNDDRSQWITKVPVAMKGKLAIAAAIAQVRPD